MVVCAGTDGGEFSCDDECVVGSVRTSRSGDVQPLTSQLFYVFLCRTKGGFVCFVL